MALFVDLVALSNGLHGSVQMDLVALFSWIGWLRHHGIFTLRPYPLRTRNKATHTFRYSATMFAKYLSPIIIPKVANYKINDETAIYKLPNL